MRNQLHKIDSLLLRVLLALALDVFVFASVLALSADWNGVPFGNVSVLVSFLFLAVVGFLVSPTMAIAEAIGARPTPLLSVIGFLIVVIAFLAQIKSKRLLPCCLAFLVYGLFAYFSVKMLEKSIGPGRSDQFGTERETRMRNRANTAKGLQKAYWLVAFAISIAALVQPLSSFAGGAAMRNPPSECKAADSDCECESGEGVSDGCIKVSLDMGRTTPWTGSRTCALKVFADDQSPMVFTPDSLFAVCGYAFKRIGADVLPDGETPSEVVFSHPGGEAVRFVFAAGEPLGRPDPGVHVKMDERLMMVDAAGWACTNAPVYYDLFEGDGTVRRFLATDATGARGRLVSVTDSRGVVRTSAEMGVDIVYGADGVRQFLTPSRLADVRVLEDGYEVSVYTVGDVPPARDATTGL